MSIDSAKKDPCIKKLEEILDFADRSENTKKAYLTYTVPFVTYCHDTLHKDPVEVTHDDIRGYLNAIQKERQLSNRTVNHAISELKLLLVASGFEWDDLQVPFKNFERPVLYVPTKTRMEELINSIDDIKKKTMVAVMYSTGMRVSEACHLKCKDISYKDKVIHITDGKGNKGRDVRLAPSVGELILKYWRGLPPDMKTRDWLFTQQRNICRPADPEYIEKFLKKHVSTVLGWEESITPHTCRRAYATHSYMDGVPIEKLSKLLGHTSIMSTMIYVHLAEAMLAQTIKSPIESLDIRI